MDQAQPARVLLVAPFPAWQWVSINRYASNLQGALTRGGYATEQAFMPWFNPPSVLHGLRTNYRKRSPGLAMHRRDLFDIVHITDHALGHHVVSLGEHSASVVTCHDLMPLYEPLYYAMPLRPLKTALITHSVRAMVAADRFIAVSSATKLRMIEHLDVAPERISVVPNMLREGLHPVAHPREILRAAGIDLPSGPLVLSVGHTGYYKNLELLLVAMAVKGLRHATLLRVGGGLTANQRALAGRLGIGERIRELGRVSASTLRAVYSVCSVLAIPSRDEGFGIPVIEAMACGLPVVSSDGGALPEVVGDAGLIVPLGDGARSPSTRTSQQFATALVSICESEEIATKLRLAGLVRADAYRPDAVLPRLQQAYAAAAEHHAVRRGG